MFLAGDIGGTKTVLALFEGDASGLTTVREARFVSADHAGLEEIVEAFLAAGSERPRAACFGVAGPVADGRASITNLPWVIDAAQLGAAFGLEPVVLLNDLQAAAYGALQLPASALAELQAGEPAQGNIAVIAPGTGLGEAILYWDGARHVALASEGGHCDFAPQSDREVRLLVFLRARYGGHVSWERVVSGMGIGNIYDFLCQVDGMAPLPDAVLAAVDDRNAAISQAGLAGEHAIAVETLAMFAALCGAEAGNLALKCYARGGVVLTGGIPAKILPALRGESFLRGLRDKGRFAGFMASLEVRVALDPRAPLLGAAYHIAGQR